MTSLYAHPEVYGLFEDHVTWDLAFYRSVAAPVQSVLELACGTGRVGLALAEDGKHVTGIDLSREMLEEFRRRLEEKPEHVRQRVTLLCASMDEFRLDGTVDLVLIPYHSFQYMLTREQQRRCLKLCHQHLRAGGRLAFDVMDAKLISEHAVPRSEGTLSTQGTTLRVIVDRAIDREARIVDETISITDVGPTPKIASYQFKNRLTYFAPEDIRALAEDIGFSVEALFRDHDRAEYVPGNRQVWILVKGPVS